MIDFRTATHGALLERIEELVEQLSKVPGTKSRTQAQIISDLLFSVTGLKVLQLADPGAAWIAALVPTWGKVGRALAAHPVGLARYLAKMDLSFSEGNREAWFDGCLRRSALEIVRVDVEPVSGPFLDPQSIAETDEELPEIATRIMPLPAESIPAGLPPGHWWWTLPSGGPDDEIDYY